MAIGFLARLRRVWYGGKTVNIGVEVEVSEVGHQMAIMPGVGIVDLSIIRKSSHHPSNVVGKERSPTKSVPSALAPGVALVNPLSDMDVTELRLSGNKMPVCVVLSEDITYLPSYKKCRSRQ